MAPVSLYPPVPSNVSGNTVPALVVSKMTPQSGASGHLFTSKRSGSLLKNQLGVSVWIARVCVCLTRVSMWIGHVCV